MEHFESWIKTHSSLASFSKWLLEEVETGFKLKGDPDPPTFYQTLAERYQGKPVTTVQLSCMQPCILLYINLCTALCTFVHFCILIERLMDIASVSPSHTEGGDGSREDLLGAEREWQV